ncbi:MAG TPA: hypothetical protein VK588_12160, partial [Chitinophagaceae bacterium]|nr:hypothetical protein [Chitinophagaceae bacterium]
MPPKKTSVKTTAANRNPPEFIVPGKKAAALFTLKVYRGEGMALLAMNWKDEKGPPRDFVGFAIEYQEPALAADSFRPIFFYSRSNLTPHESLYLPFVLCRPFNG